MALYCIDVERCILFLRVARTHIPRGGLTRVSPRRQGGTRYPSAAEPQSETALTYSTGEEPVVDRSLAWRLEEGVNPIPSEPYP